MSSIKLDRATLARFLPDHQSIVAFEQLLTAMSASPASTIEEANNNAVTAMTFAQQALVSLAYLASELEQQQSAPAPLPQPELEDMAPRQQFGTIAPQDSDAVDITGGTIGVSAGTVGAPSLYLVDLTTGWYRISANVIGLAVAGVNMGTYSASGPSYAQSVTTSQQFVSTVATGTAPLSVASTTQVANLNSSQLIGGTWAVPGAIGATTPGSGAFTTISASGQMTSMLATGTAPLVVASTTQVSNLNVSQLVGAAWDAPNPIGSTTRNTAAFSSLLVNLGAAVEASSQSSFANLNAAEYTFPTIWAGHGTTKDMVVYNGDTTGASGAASVLFVSTKNSATGRSINTAGTINASGADYAEYMTKADDCGVVAKGQIVGITADGKVTDKWASAIAFAIKSTNPSYVGGDTWGTFQIIGDRPVMTPREPDETDADYLEREDAFLVDLLSYESDLESARRAVDRIAFSGRVPCNVTAAAAGDYIVPAQDGAGIKGTPVATPTFEQFMRAVGRVIAIEPDGRPLVMVKSV